MSNAILFRRLGYFLSPQLDIYRHLAPHLAGKDVLEVGFGTGFGVLQYAQEARCVTAIETDTDAVEFATANLPLPNVMWIQSDVTKLWIPERFDAVVMIEVLEHIKDWQKALENVCTYLKPGGQLYISARNRFAELRKNDLHEREWSAVEFVEALSLFFPVVTLYDYTLTHIQTEDTHQTPLIAVAKKGA